MAARARSARCSTRSGCSPARSTQNKSSIVAALENTNRLAGELRKQDETIKATLDDVPGALASINRQRDDLVKLLKALTRLSGVGVKVIQASKESTINSLRDLAPVLDGFAKAGQNFPKSFQVFLTYPFVDEAVGRDPQVARNLHMGDYTNLSVNLDLNLEPAQGPPADACPRCVCPGRARRRRRTLTSAADQVDRQPAGAAVHAGRQEEAQGRRSPATVAALNCDDGEPDQIADRSSSAP